MRAGRMMSVSGEICVRYLFLPPPESVELQFKIIHAHMADSKKKKKNKKEMPGFVFNSVLFMVACVTVWFTDSDFF